MGTLLRVLYRPHFDPLRGCKSISPTDTTKPPEGGNVRPCWLLGGGRAHHADRLFGSDFHQWLPFPDRGADLFSPFEDRSFRHGKTDVGEHNRRHARSFGWGWIALNGLVGPALPRLEKQF